MRFEIKHFNELSTTELYEILKTRFEIFVTEQECIYQDLDDKDQDAIHVFCWNDDSLKPGIIEEAAEVICGINVMEKTGNPENLKEELGDLLLQVVMQVQIAEEEGIFTIDDVCKGISEKLIRRHPHVFGDVKVSGTEEVLTNWEEIKKKEKEGKEDANLYLPEAFDEACELIDKARKRKGFA